jgi:hypothetical protein
MSKDTHSWGGAFARADLISSAVAFSSPFAFSTSALTASEMIEGRADADFCVVSGEAFGGDDLLVDMVECRGLFEVEWSSWCRIVCTNRCIYTRAGVHE